MDDDLASEAIPADGSGINMKTVSVAMSGAVAVVAYINVDELLVSSTGDCAAVLGSLSENETWVAKSLTTAHCATNQKEVDRIEDNHPGEQPIVGDRLLGKFDALELSLFLSYR